jgi:hypothetical protein
LGKGIRHLDRLIVLGPTKKDIECKAYQGPTADPLGFPFPEKTEQQWEKNDSRED